MPPPANRQQDNRQALLLIGAALLLAAAIGVASVMFYRDPIPTAPTADAGIAHPP